MKVFLLPFEYLLFSWPGIGDNDDDDDGDDDDDDGGSGGDDDDGGGGGGGDGGNNDDNDDGHILKHRCYWVDIYWSVEWTTNWC